MGCGKRLLLNKTRSFLPCNIIFKGCDCLIVHKKMNILTQKIVNYMKKNETQSPTRIMYHTAEISVSYWKSRKTGVKVSYKNQNCNYLYFRVSLSSHSNRCVLSCRPFVILMTSPASLVGCRSFFCHLHPTKSADVVRTTKGLQERTTI